MARLIWTEPALADLEAIADYIALDNPAAARPLVLDLVAIDRQLAECALDAAEALGGDAKKIAQSEREIMVKSVKALAKGKEAEAIEHYGHAWKKAMDAIKHL